MFKFVVFLAVVAVAAAKPGFLAPLLESRSAVIGETTVESHGNSVVHASAPVVTSYVAAAPAPIAYAAAPTALIAEKTISSHGNAVVHASAPLITSYAAAAPIYKYGYAAAAPAAYYF